MITLAPPSVRSIGGNVLLSPARAQFKAIFDACIGLKAEGASLGEYDQAIITSGLDLVDPAKRAAMAKMSGCLLFMREVLRRAGLRSAILDAAYRVAMAEEDVLELVKSAGALRPATYVPGVGDGVIIDGPTHGFWCSAITPGAAHPFYRTVQGGERTPDGAECIAALDRSYIVGPHGASFDGRPVRYVIDCTALYTAESPW